MRRLLFALLCCLVLRPAAAQPEEDAPHVRVKGFADTYHALRTDDPNDWMASRTRVRGELTLEKGDAGIFVSMNAVYNALLTERSGLFLREAYLSYAPDGWEIRAGRQIIVWGVADAVRLTDILSPMDYTEFLAQDYDDIRIPVDALRVRCIRPNWSVEAVAVPITSLFELSTDPRNPWAVSLPSADVPCTLTTGAAPRRTLRNAEFGGRVGCYLSGVDFSLSALRTWNKMPVFLKDFAADGTLRCQGVCRRMTMIGGDLSLPVGKFVLRVEAAEYVGEAQEPEVGEPVRRRNSTNLLAGADWYAGSDWTLGVQYSHKRIAGSMAGIASYRNSGMATVRISKELLRNTLCLSTFAYVDVANGGIYDRLSGDYALTDQIHVMLGCDFFHADAGLFAMYDRNSEVWIKLKYNF